jgi:peptidyl-prolyl cis-trans isomerase C
MELARQTLLIRELFAQWQRDNPVTEAEARTEYDRLRREEAGTEFRARHILVETEDEARRLIAQIRGGADFAELATRHSKDPGSARAGGDLDFARPEAYVPEFGQALARLQRGQVTESPVRTQFGWHIIRLEETREVQFPPFEAVRAQIEQQLAQDKLQRFQLSLRDGARTDFRFSR